MEIGNNALQVVENKGLRMAHMSVQDLVDQKDFIQDVVRKVMRKGKNYGTIPGCGDKLALFKSGAEILSTTFQMAPEFDVKIGDLGNGHREYQIKCTLKSRLTGKFIGDGVGSCSTMETKYRYRSGERKCPKCGKETIIKGKKEYGGGWLCFAKKGGCGAKFSDSDASIASQPIGKVENDNIADTYNTCLKMAKKRAFVDANITATSTSDVFLQDMEEESEVEAGEHVAEPEETPIVAPASLVEKIRNYPEPKEFVKEPDPEETVTVPVMEVKGTEYQPGKWRYGIRDNAGNWYSTFSKTDHATGEECRIRKHLAQIRYRVHAQGTKLYRNIVSITESIGETENDRNH